MIHLGRIHEVGSLFEAEQIELILRSISFISICLFQIQQFLEFHRGGNYIWGFDCSWKKYSPTTWKRKTNCFVNVNRFQWALPPSFEFIGWTIKLDVWNCHVHRYTHQFGEQKIKQISSGVPSIPWRQSHYRKYLLEFSELFWVEIFQRNVCMNQNCDC